MARAINIGIICIAVFMMVFGIFGGKGKQPTSSPTIKHTPELAPKPFTPMPSQVELRFTNRQYVGGNYRQKASDDVWWSGNSWIPGSAAVAESNKGYHVTYHSRYFNTVAECEKAREVIIKTNPKLGWSTCR